MWPRSIALLCQWHLLAAVWKWLWDRHHQIENKDRPHLLRLFRRIIYAQTRQAYEDARTDMDNDLVFEEYPNYGKHLADSYFHRSEVWSSHHRFENALPTNDVDTNNLCEASFKVCIIIHDYYYSQ